VSVFAVDFKDHTGYIPEWAIEIGEFQALMTCANMDYGTFDQKWCLEYSGYYNDKITKELEEYENQNYDDPNQDSTNYLSNSDYIPQFNKKIFDDKPKHIPYTSYVNSLYDFSLIPPSKWSIHENAELIDNTNAAPIAFYSHRGHLEYTSNFTVLYMNLGSSNFDLLRFSSDEEVLDLFISELTADKINVKIKQKNIESYLDGYKIIVQYVETVKIDDKKFLTLQLESIAYLMASGDTYVLIFASTPEDFAVNVANFRTSANTFHVGFIEYDEPLTKSESQPTCGTGTILENGKCIVDKSNVPSNTSGGGCLIATATYGTEMASQVQLLREIRDNKLLQTESGTSFMNTFNEFYYSFSPIIADYERENPAFKEAVKVVITPVISSLSILNHVDMSSEESVLGYGISLILLNIGMYFVAPAIVIIGIKKKI
jgi:hypothetical protein